MNADALISDLAACNTSVSIETTVDDGSITISWLAEKGAEVDADDIWADVMSALEGHGIDFWACMGLSGASGGGDPTGRWGEWVRLNLDD